MKSPYFKDEKDRPVIAIQKKDGWHIVYVEDEADGVKMKTRKVRNLSVCVDEAAAKIIIEELAPKKKWTLVESEETFDQSPNTIPFPDMSGDEVSPLRTSDADEPGIVIPDDFEVVESIIVFGFMAGDEEMMIITNTGLRLFEDAPGVPDVAYAKEAFLNLPYENVVGNNVYELVWSDDPSTDERIVKACSIQSTSGTPGNATNGSTACRMCGCTDDSPCTTESGLCVMGDDGICSVCSGIDKPLDPENRANSVPYDPDTELADDLENTETVAADGTIYDVIPVSVKASTSERVLRAKIREVHMMELEAQASATEARKDIKGVWKEIYRMTELEPKIQVRCRIEFDWDKDIKNWISMDDNTIVQSKPVTDAERQVQLDLKTETPAEAAVEGHGTELTGDQTDTAVDVEEGQPDSTVVPDTAPEPACEETAPDMSDEDSPTIPGAWKSFPFRMM